MRISVGWLEDFVSTKVEPEDLVAMLTSVGLEVEAIERPGKALDGVVVGRVAAIERHPNAERLQVCLVEDGGEDKFTVVCGASNFKAGDNVALAKVGARLPGDRVIERATVRGVESHAMLCSGKELGVSDDASGILVLPCDAAVGTPLARALGLDDVLLEVNVTPNRPDCLSHQGIAREVAAATQSRLREARPKVGEGKVRAAGAARVTIEAAACCRRYAARVVEKVRIGPSPAWMQQRLVAVGVRPINNAVDVTNYVLMELGHPLHAFDLDKVAGKQIVVRTAWPGERMTTLDGVERELRADDLVIADRDRASALAGVMGGSVSEVSTATTRILLESAWFEPCVIRRTAARHGLHTEASHRFERGADIGMVPVALDRAAQLLAELCGGEVLKGRIDEYPRRMPARTINLRWDRISELIGAEVPTEESRRILRSLGLRGGKEAKGLARLTVPSHRGDLSREEDLVEEVARLRGYDRIPSTMPPAVTELADEGPERSVESRLRLALAANGFDEVVSYAFVPEADIAALYTTGECPQSIMLRNPISAEQAAMRSSLLPGLLATMGHSLRRQVGDLRLYELAVTFMPRPTNANGQPAVERKSFAGVFAGRRHPRTWAHGKEELDFYDAKGAVEAVLQSAGVGGVSFVPGDAPHLHPRSACDVLVGEVRLGSLGEVHPATARHFDLPRSACCFELWFDEVVRAARLVPRYAGVPRFPAVLRDVALVVPEELAAEKVRQSIASDPLVEEAVLFDVYRGAPIPEGKKNLAYAVRYRRSDRTLTDDEANAAHAAMVKRLEQEFSAHLREQ